MPGAAAQAPLQRIADINHTLEQLQDGELVKKNVMRVGFAAAASAAVVGFGATSAQAITVSPHPDGSVEFVPNGSEWWTCVAGSLAAPYVSIQAPKPGPGHSVVQFTPGIDVAVACTGSDSPRGGVAKIVRPGE